ncbi:MAG TPA: (Fe-S)-binding protein [Armatimonadota bacterium]|jgi:glycolate oxidase iron-sulfur subunit
MNDTDLIAGELLRCNKCGYCQSVCPTYQISQDEAGVARGRLELLSEVQDGELEPLEALRGPFFDCLMCGACTQACFSAVRTDELMVRARQDFHRRHGQPFAQSFIFHRLLGYPERLTALMRLAGAGKRSGLTRLFRRLGLLGWINATLEGAEGLVETMPRRFLRDRLAEIGFIRRGVATGEELVLPRSITAPRGPRVAYFIGCGTNFQQPAAGEAALRLLAHAGCEVVALPNVCCGLPPYSYGDLEAARTLARQNLAILGRAQVDYLVTECGSCSRFLKQYGELLADDPAAVAEAEDLAVQTRDFTELLASLPLPPPVRPWPGVVTYHDPCHLGRGQGLRAEPRRLLTEAAGATLVELPEADWCCGGAGSYNITHPEMSLAILRRKVENIRGTGADTVVTACPSCLIQLSWGLREGETPIAVRHVAEVVAAAQGLPQSVDRDGGNVPLTAE